MKSTFLSAAALLALVAALGLSSALANRDAAVRGVAYIQTTQQADGGFGGFGVGHSVDAILAIRAAGFDPNDFGVDGATPADFLEANIDEIAASPGLAAKGALAAQALGLDEHDIAGVDLIAAVEMAYDDATGQYAEDAFNHALALLGYAASGNTAPEAAITALRDMQHDDGGWGYDGVSDPDTTALGLQALIAAGVPASDEDAAAALAQLQGAQGNDAGWGFDPEESNAASTAFVIQALIAAGEDVDGDTYTKGGVTPLAYLESLQQDDGSFPGFDPAYATIQAVSALAGRSYAEMANTPVVEDGPPSASATPSPSPSPSAASTATPGAPETGSGTANGADGVPLVLIVALTMLAAAGGVRVASAVTRRS